MAKTTVYQSFEVREGFGRDRGDVQLETDSRSDADAKLEQLWHEGKCVQLFGIKSHDANQYGERVLLRSLVAPKAA